MASVHYEASSTTLYVADNTKYRVFLFGPLNFYRCTLPGVTSKIDTPPNAGEVFKYHFQAHADAFFVTGAGIRGCHLRSRSDARAFSLMPTTISATELALMSCRNDVKQTIGAPTEADLHRWLPVPWQCTNRAGMYLYMQMRLNRFT